MILGQSQWDCHNNRIYVLFTHRACPVRFFVPGGAKMPPRVSDRTFSAWQKCLSDGTSYQRRHFGLMPGGL